MTVLDATVARLGAAGVVAERIRDRAALVDPGKVLLTLLMLPLVVLGWSARKVLLVALVVLSWLGAAVVVGWEAAAPRVEGG